MAYMIIDNRQKTVMLFLYAVARSKAIKAKQAAAAMECNKAVRGKAAAKKAATLMGFTGRISPIALGGNTTQMTLIGQNAGGIGGNSDNQINPVLSNSDIKDKGMLTDTGMAPIDTTSSKGDIKISLGKDGTAQINIKDIDPSANLNSPEDVAQYMKDHGDTLNSKIKDALLNYAGTAGVSKDCKVEVVLFEGSSGTNNIKVAQEYVLSGTVGGGQVTASYSGMNIEMNKNFKVGFDTKEGEITITTKNQYGEHEVGYGFNKQTISDYGKAELIEMEYGSVEYKAGISVTASINDQGYNDIYRAALAGGAAAIMSRGLGVLPQLSRWIPAYAVP